MPPKSSKAKESIKAEIHDKVRGLRLKQQKWMNQRDTSLKQSSQQVEGTLPANTKTVVGRQLNNNNKHVKDSIDNGNSHDKKTDPSLVQKKPGFQSWLSARQTNECPPDSSVTHDRTNSPSMMETYGVAAEIQSPSVSKEYDPTNYLSRTQGSRYDRLVVDNGRNTHAGGSTVESTNSYETYTSISAKSRKGNAANVPADKFDELAERIIDRVKDELDMCDIDAVDVENERAPCRSREWSGEEADPGVHLKEDAMSDSHACPTCRARMLPPSHNAMLLIPCGHTACKSCARTSMTSSCPQCGARVQSVTQNLMLQQIIVDFHHKSGAARHECDVGGNVNTPSLRSSRIEGNGVRESDAEDRVKGRRITTQPGGLGETYSRHPLEDNGVTCDVPKSYEEREEDYRNLCLRCEVLREEEYAIQTTLADLDHQQSQQRIQMSNISTAQDKLRQKISLIEGEITELERHKNEYSTTCDEIDVQMNKRRKKLEMVRQTIGHLRSDMEQMRPF